MMKLTVQQSLAAINSMLVELGVVLLVVSTAKHWGAPCPPLFQVGVGVCLLGIGLFLAPWILRRGKAYSPQHERYARAMSYLAMPTLLAAAVCLALSFVL